MINKPLTQQFLRFAAVGAIGTGVQYATLWAGTHWLGISAVYASAIGYALGSIFNYALNYFFTFDSKKSHVEAAGKYYAVLAVGFSLNFVLMALFVNVLEWNYWIAQIITTGIGLMWNFLGSRFWAFKPR
ncbi:MAG: GtrA family protein [Betaproteobacteria bacterium]